MFINTVYQVWADFEAFDEGVLMSPSDFMYTQAGFKLTFILVLAVRDLFITLFGQIQMTRVTGGHVMYAVKNNTDLFSVEKYTGQVYLLAPLDGTNNIHHVQIEATDGEWEQDSWIAVSFSTGAQICF